ncbi:NAD(P)-dependent dehydrogenase, short-chain alcohol dehydrogenase family [Amphritea atlantica]|uniref:NAD(P)-dependent dehydrogenase, short-chain alcohol dehydrogenase family n=1 Tax=Amphritea atlantica TaxID=355243 RepID=A0A1H9KFB8_9GAMM|nr:3-hydroxyacyl-CoA dehydrogenase [Amphritea atlantica]SEQ97768.1 NAD(P)-dependent dehydrogenase, short-chain alcohol dehydrogenase family [Amphritea atlantica]
MDINQKVFIVTGASSGLGEAVARRLVDQGASVVLADINAERGAAVADSLADKAVFCKTDITDEQSAQNCIDTAVNTFGCLNGLVNCAGIPGAERVLGKNGVHRLETFNRALQVNLLGTFNMVRLAASVMSEQDAQETGERGVIINTASVAAFDGQIGQAAYAASKGGMCAMTLPLARELARFGIRVMTIAPGIFKTPMMDVLPEDVQASLGAAVPFPSRLGEPSEYAQLVQQIIENCMLNGEVIRLDGAIRMAAK